MPVFGGEDFGHDEEGHVGVAERVGDDEEDETGQRKPAETVDQLLLVGRRGGGVLQVEEGAQSGQRDGHEEAREQQQHAPAGPIDEEHGRHGGRHLDGADDHRRDVVLHAAARLVEDGHGEVDDGVDAAELLQQHQAHRKQQRLQHRPAQQVAPADGLLGRVALAHVGLDPLELGRHVGMAVFQMKMNQVKLGTFADHDQVPWCLEIFVNESWKIVVQGITVFF